MNINANTELTPHTFRRTFTTYHAESGMPLPLLSKLLGHKSVRTTALYWKNIYGDDDTDNILAGKNWLENKEKEPPKPPSTENFPRQLPANSEPDIIRGRPVISAKKPSNQDNSPPLVFIKQKPVITNYQPKPLISGIPTKSQEKFSLNIISEKKEISEQLPAITNQREQPTSKEEILLTKIKQLEEQLKQVQAENTHLKLENKHLKVLIKQDQETEAKIIQTLPFKSNK